MRPNTSVRQPVIAGARRQQLSELLRVWRSQPRKRSPRLFWSLLTLTFALDTALVLLGVQLLGFADPTSTAPTLERRTYIPYARKTVLWEPLRHWEIRANGQPRHFESFCRESVRRLTGVERFENSEPLAVVVSWMLNHAAWEDYPFLRCEDAALRTLLSRGEHRLGRYVEPALLRRSKAFRKVLRGVAAKGESEEEIPLSPLERRAVELQDRLTLFDRIHSGGVDGGDGAEMKSARAALGEAYCSGSEDLFAAALADFLNASRRALRMDEDSSTARRLGWERWLNEYRPKRQAMVFSVLAAMLLAASTMAQIRRTLWRRGFLVSGLLACSGCLGWAVAGIVGRTLLHGGQMVGDGSEGIAWASSIIVSLALVLALLGRDRFTAPIGALIACAGFALANRWPPLFAANWPTLPNLAHENGWLLPHELTLISAYAALTLAWGIAAFGLARMALAPPTDERLRGLAASCLRSIGVAAILLTVSAFLDGFRAMHSNDCWRGWNAQAMGTLLVLPACCILLYARWMGRIQSIGSMMLAVLGCAALAMIWQTALSLGVWDRHIASVLAEGAVVYAIGLVSFSLAAHAALRYYFGRQRIVEG